ncbi:DUF4038 domain-containing protein [Flammeovirgaceae bacterium SG7u.111]|nr:DUF4038 domain-containing protein [Flammeovirgaceae bacterium SG7u.132]WPO34388.1 DUF4038 domain-containing protein [Flammeovirgaceae bacterium SG7u.111]
MIKSVTLLAMLLFSWFSKPLAAGDIAIWQKLELEFESSKPYENPLYDVTFNADFVSPTGRTIKINGFWGGENNWKIRFAPDELGVWTFTTNCSEKTNLGLHGKKGSFTCVKSESSLPLFQKGAITRSKGAYHLTYSDGTPFFWTACTAWNGALKSTDEEWEDYLSQRAKNNYNVIQFVTTQWRGCETNAEREVAFTGSGRIELNPSFFKRIDEKIDKINEFGLVAAPVLLWALPSGEGMHLSPGYFLPETEAALLANYLVARYGGNQIVWILGGDGKYTGEYEQRWKKIGQAVFGEEKPGLVAQHPHGSSWIGEIYKNEHWLDIVGYQSSHSNGKPVVDWVNKGPMAKSWDKLPPRPIINMEPCYEKIFNITAEDVRNASYWSVFATPLAGITYGANGIWPWIQKEGDLIENHGGLSKIPPDTWRQSIDFPGSLQVGYLSGFLQQFDWWTLKPTPELLTKQPGNTQFNHFISVVSTDSKDLVMAYVPKKTTFKLRNPLGKTYKVHWFNPIENTYLAGSFTEKNGLLEFSSPSSQDSVLVLEEK